MPTWHFQIRSHPLAAECFSRRRPAVHTPMVRRLSQRVPPDARGLQETLEIHSMEALILWCKIGNLHGVLSLNPPFPHAELHSKEREVFVNILMISV